MAETREVSDNLERWTALLDELDRQLLRSQSEFGLGSERSRIWPMDEIRASIGPVGTVPLELESRARGLLVAYAEALTRIQLSRRLVGEHIEMLQSARATADASPMYLDSVS